MFKPIFDITKQMLTKFECTCVLITPFGRIVFNISVALKPSIHLNNIQNYSRTTLLHVAYIQI